MKINVFEEVQDLYKIITFDKFRETPGVIFDLVPVDELPRIDSIDRVVHKIDAISPGSVGGVERPWYMHPHQADNLLVMHGTRIIDIYTKKHGRIETFTVTPDRIEKDGKVLYEGGAMLVWPRLVFHRIRSGKEGSASINFAVHYEGFNIETNFNVYDLDTATGRFNLLRKGSADQKPSS